MRFFGPRAEADVDDELRFHFDMRVRDYMARGMSEPDARAAVVLRLGDVQRVRDECVAITHRRERQTTRAQLLDALVQDVRFAFRTLGRQKGWTAVAVLTLALGIGANTAVYSVVSNLVLHPLPYPDANRLVLPFLEPSEGNSTGIRVSVSPSPIDVKAWIGARSFERVQAVLENDVTVERRGQAAWALHAAYVQPAFPAFAGRQPIAGRMFTDAEVASREPVALLSEGVWRARFGSDTSVLGSVVTIDDKAHTIIGVLPSSLRPPRLGRAPADIWLPLEITPDKYGMAVIGRLRPGVTSVDAARELDSLSARAATAAGAKAPPRFRARLNSPADMVSFKESLVMLSGAVALVLLIACANVAHLLLSRSATRGRELAIRAALGAGSARLSRQLLTESLVLSGAGCVGGVLVGWLGLRAVVALRPESLEALRMAELDASALWASVALSVVTGIAFGLFAAIQSARQSTHESLKAGALSTSTARSHQRLRSLLVVSEMALSTTLLVAASLLIRSVVHLQTTDPGFEPTGLYSIKPGLPEKRYPNEATRRAFYEQMAERALRLPGVQGVTIAAGAPPGFSFLIGALHIEGEEAPKPHTTSLIRYNGVGPDYFRTMGMRLVAGATFSDSTGKAPELVVNEGFAAKHWPGQSAVGKRVKVIRYDGSGTWSAVVGVVGDAATGGLTDQRSSPVLYVPRADYDNLPNVILRTGPRFAGLPALRGIVTSIDARLPPATTTNIQSAMAATAAGPRFIMALLVAFTVLALALAAVGLYGVMSYGVAQRTREIGIRIALGATRGAIARGIVFSALTLAAAGALLGLGGAWWATKLLDQMLYGVPRTDPASFVAGGVVLLGTALLASVVPMNRAAAVDPIIAMRAD